MSVRDDFLAWVGTDLRAAETAVHRRGDTPPDEAAFLSGDSGEAT
jgi:hypothetical protein